MSKRLNHPKSSLQAGQSGPKEAAATLPVSPGGTPAELLAPADPISLKPDGYYWQTEDGHREFGPFESYELAAADLHVGEENLGPSDALNQVEAEIGIAGWIDADTGSPAEGQSPPHLERE
jgi:hypothetical protein